MRALVITVGGVIAGAGIGWALTALTDPRWPATSGKNDAVFWGFLVLGLGVGLLVAGAAHRGNQEPDRRHEPERSPADVA